MVDITHEVTCRMNHKDVLQVRRMSTSHPYIVGISVTSGVERSQLIILDGDDAFALAVAIMETANSKREGR